jgi:hypothetical protein
LAKWNIIEIYVPDFEFAVGKEPSRGTVRAFTLVSLVSLRER